MPAKSEKQRRAAGAALNMKIHGGKLAGPAGQMAKSVTEKELIDFTRKPKK